MTLTAVKIQEKGQVTIPSEIRKNLNLKKGDLVTFVETKGGVIMTPAEIVVSKALDEIGKAFKRKGLTIEEIISRGRETRSKLIEKEYGISSS